ncbi:hypothetical protein [Sporosarcina sp. ITBMC105]
MVNEQPSIEELRRDIARLQSQIDARRAKRVALGLPKDRPGHFVKAEHAAEMIKRVQPVYETLARYLRFLDESKKLEPFPVERFDKYRNLLTLIEWSEESLQGLYAGALRMSIALLADVDSGYDRVFAKLHSYLKFSRNCQQFMNADIYRAEASKGTDEELDEIIADYQRHYDEVVAPQVVLEQAVLEAADEQEENE